MGMKTKIRKRRTVLTPPSCSVCHLADTCLEFYFARSLIMFQEQLPVSKGQESLKSKLEAGLFAKDNTIHVLHRICVCGQKSRRKDV